MGKPLSDSGITRLLCCRMREEPGNMVTHEHKNTLKLQVVGVV